MPDYLLLSGALLLNVAGFAWLALAMDGHWQQIRVSRKPPKGRKTVLRLAAGAAFPISLLLCTLSDHATIAVLVWVMALTAAALLVAFALTWLPELLRPLSWLAACVSDFRSKQ